MKEMFQKFSKFQSQQGQAEDTFGPRRNESSWRANSRKSGPKRGGGIPRTSVGKPILNPNPPRSVPQGQYLSKTSTELSNDPLSEKAYFPYPGTSFSPVAREEKIYPGATVLPALQDQTYTTLGSVNPSYTKTVPKCAHDYYLGVMITHRFLKLHLLGGKYLSPDEQSFVSSLDSVSFTVPKLVSLFGNGLGDTAIPGGRKLSFSFAKPELHSGGVVLGERQYDIPGYFGPIIQHLGAYAGYPCLGVYAQRILQDLWRTGNPQATEWDLPEDFRVAEKPINRNCLGYSPAVRLSREHLAFLTDNQITLENFNSENPTLPLFSGLLAAVHIKMSQCRIPLHAISYLTTGSQGQIPVEEVVQQNTSLAITASYRGKTSSELPSAEGHLGTSFLYNVYKESLDIRIVKSLMPISYRVNDAVDPDALRGLNSLYIQSTSLVKQEGFETTAFTAPLRLVEAAKVETSH